MQKTTLYIILTHLAYTANGIKRDISNNYSVLKARGKCALADIIFYCKMTSIMALDGVTSFLRLKDVTNTRQSIYWREFFSAMAKIWKKLKSSNVYSSLIVCLNRNRSALMRELLSNNSLFVGQLYKDKSLAMRARDLIFFTTDLQTVSYYLSIHCKS